LNLASGNYVTAGPDRLLDFGPEGTNTLRAAGVDLYLSDEAITAPKTTNNDGLAPRLTALDWRLLRDYVDESSGGSISDPADAQYGGVLERFTVRRFEREDPLDNQEETI